MKAHSRPFATGLLILFVSVGATTSPPAAREVVVCDAPGSQSNPTIVADGKGGVFIAWSDSRRGSLDVFAQHLLASGVVDSLWPPQGLPVCEADNDQAAPAIATDGHGGAIVTWFDQRGGVDHDVYAQRILASGRVDPKWPQDGVALCTAPGHQQAPAIVSDGAGGAIVTWFDLRAGADAHIYAQHVLASGAMDPRWTQDGVALCMASGAQYFPKAIPDSAGGAIVAWYDHRGADYDIYAQRVLASGVVDPRWPENGRALCTARRDQRNPVLVSDQRGGAWVAWEDARDDARKDVYAQHVLGSGVVDPAWPQDGQAIAAGPGSQDHVTLAADESGGAFVAWDDDRGGDANIVVRHVTRSGVIDPKWPADGLVVCAATDEQSTPVIARDGAGGAFVAWQDRRNRADYDIYGTWITGGGAVAPNQPADGRPLCVAPGNQLNATLGKTTNGVVCAWEDRRGGDESDLRAVFVTRPTSATRPSSTSKAGR